MNNPKVMILIVLLLMMQAVVFDISMLSVLYRKNTGLFFTLPHKLSYIEKLDKQNSKGVIGKVEIMMLLSNKHDYILFLYNKVKVE